LLAHQVLGVPVRPVVVGLSDPRLVLTVRGRRTPQRARQIARRREVRRCGVDATGQPRCDLLEQPSVAVRITERGVRAIAAMIGAYAASWMKAGTFNGDGLLKTLLIFANKNK